MPYNQLQCPYCLSLNIEPFRGSFHCNDCNKDFPQAMVEEKPPEPKKKGVKK